MRGAKVRYVQLGTLMREGRQRKDMTLDSASSMLGLINCSYLSRCELGTCNFPLAKLRRATELYGIPVSDVIQAAIEDYRIGMRRALEVK